MDESPLEPQPNLDDGGDIPEITAMPIEEERKPHRKNQPVQSPPALTIHIQSWATPVLAILMLIVGLAAGFYARPLFDKPIMATNPTANAEVVDVPPTQAQAQTSPTQSDQAQAEQQQQLMDLVVSKTRHFEGNENAPVTLIEFSDFQ